MVDRYARYEEEIDSFQSRSGTADFVGGHCLPMPAHAAEAELVSASLAKFSHLDAFLRTEV